MFFFLFKFEEIAKSVVRLFIILRCLLHPKYDRNAHPTPVDAFLLINSFIITFIYYFM